MLRAGQRLLQNKPQSRCDAVQRSAPESDLGDTHSINAERVPHTARGITGICLGRLAAFANNDVNAAAKAAKATPAVARNVPGKSNNPLASNSSTRAAPTNSIQFLRTSHMPASTVQGATLAPVPACLPRNTGPQPHCRAAWSAGRQEWRSAATATMTRYASARRGLDWCIMNLNAHGSAADRPSWPLDQRGWGKYVQGAIMTPFCGWSNRYVLCTKPMPLPTLSGLLPAAGSFVCQAGVRRRGDAWQGGRATQRAERTVCHAGVPQQGIITAA